MLTYLLLPWALLGAWSYRTRGGGNWPINLPRIIDLTVWSLLITIPLWFLAPLWAVIPTIGLVIGATSLGHGDFIDFGTSGRTDSDEYLSRFLHLFTDKRDGPIHDTLGMMLSGMTYTIFPALIAIIFSDPIWVLWLPLGALKGVAYALAWDFKKHIANPTVLGELLTGFFICGATGLLWLGI